MFVRFLVDTKNLWSFWKVDNKTQMIHYWYRTTKAYYCYKANSSIFITQYQCHLQFKRETINSVVVVIWRYVRANLQLPVLSMRCNLFQFSALEMILPLPTFYHTYVSTCLSLLLIHYNVGLIFSMNINFWHMLFLTLLVLVYHVYLFVSFC